MADCALYDNPGLYDALFPNAANLASHDDEERSRRITLSEQFYLAEAQQAGGTILELGCGSGRLTIPIAQRGLEIIGLDASATMLDAAREKAAGCTVPPRFVHADMREFDFAERFPLILIAGNSLLHLMTADDLRQCFSCARRHLAPGGRLIFDVSNPNPERLALPPGQRRAVLTFRDPERGEVRVEEGSNYDARTQVHHATWYFSSPAQPDFRTIEFRLRMIFPQELASLLDSAGLRLEERYGEFSREPFVAVSPRQVCICRTV